MAAQRKVPRFGRRVRAAWIGAAGAGIVAAVAAGWLTHIVAHRETPSTAPASAPTTASTATPVPRTAAPPAAAPAPTPAASAPSVTEIAPTPPARPETVRAPAVMPSPPERRAAAPRRPDRRPAPPRDTASASAPQIASLRALQASALQARARAVAAGATALQLAAGDSQSAPVEALIAQGKLADAAARLTAASGMWLDVERAALTASSTRAPRSGAESTRSAAPPAPPPTPATRTASTQPAANPGTEIGELIARYARAISSRDIVAVRRAYPGLTAEQQKGFEQFFRSVRSLRAAFTVSHLDVTGATAEARVGGAYDFVGSDGKSQHQPITFRATLRRDGGSWQLVAVN
jgi:ketosteroid isomerase-like protein